MQGGTVKNAKGGRETVTATTLVKSKLKNNFFQVDIFRFIAL